MDAQMAYRPQAKWGGGGGGEQSPIRKQHI